MDFIADEKLDVWADEFKTEQVVRNYLTNAIHHVENEKRIEVRIRRDGDKAHVTVFNSGKPIPRKTFQNCGISSIKWIKRIQESMEETV